MHRENLPENINDALWQIRFESLRRFYRQNHRYPARGETFEGFQLGNWLKWNRRLYKLNKLEPGRARQVASLKYVFDNECRRSDKRWMEHFRLLMDFKREHGRWPRTKDSHRGFALGPWMYRNRVFYYHKKLPPNRLQMLLEAGYVFQPLRPIDKQWEENFGYLKIYIERNPQRWNAGTKLLPRAKRLRAWCLEMRKRYQLGTLKENQRKKLESVGFPFAQKVSHQERFQRQVQAYTDFKRMYPHKRVEAFTEYPKGNALGRWCIYVRHRTRSAFPGELVRELDKLGFEWDTSEKKWDAKFADVEEFYRVHGRLPSQSKNMDSAEKRLVVWLRFQKKRWLEKKLSETKKNRLRPYLQKTLRPPPVSLPRRRVPGNPIGLASCAK